MYASMRAVLGGGRAAQASMRVKKRFFFALCTSLCLCRRVIFAASGGCSIVLRVLSLCLFEFFFCVYACVCLCARNGRRCTEEGDKAHRGKMEAEMAEWK